MNKWITLLSFFLILFTAEAGWFHWGLSKKEDYRRIKEGVEFIQYEVPSLAPRLIYTDKISVVKLDPDKVQFKLLSYKRDEKQALKPEQKKRYYFAGRDREFYKKFPYSVLINSSMFKKDYLSSTGYMRDGKYINNPSHVDRFRAIFVASANQAALAPADMLEKGVTLDWERKIDDYDLVIENFRTISDFKNLWSPSNKRFRYMFQLGFDKYGSVLFISYESHFGRSIYEFNNLLLQLPLDVEKSMYLDGGTPGIMKVKTPAFDREFGAQFKAFAPNLLIVE